MIIEIIAVSLLEIGCLLLGYYIGKEQKPNIDVDVRKIMNDFKKGIDGVVNEQLKPGPIRRPTALQLSKFKEDPRRLEAKKAMKESLDQVPELVKAKEYMEKMK